MKLVVGGKGNTGSTRAILEQTREMIKELYVFVLNSRYNSGRTYVHDISSGDLKQEAQLAYQSTCHINMVLTWSLLSILSALFLRA
ncbi:MAG: hypothetical protein J7M18_02315 [Candidatus Eremiobacteraeota bacterium]|nr:hypothetical protein [Candidatus Eremiobacteraeota bacterium]